MLKRCVLIVTLLQPVVRYPWRNVMDMVKPDVRGEPPEHAGQLEMGAPSERGLDIVPVVMRRPVRILELMLDVEQPHAGHCRENS